MIASSIVDMEYAYVTGAASGLGLAISTFLTRKGIKVFMADFNGEALEIAANEISASFAVVDVSNWDSQLKGFKQALAEYGRIDYVYPIAGIGENTWIPPLSPSQSADDFAKPNLSIIDVNVSGLLFTLALALQQFRRQVVGGNGFRGKSKNPRIFYFQANHEMFSCMPGVYNGNLPLRGKPSIQCFETYRHRTCTLLWHAASSRADHNECLLPQCDQNRFQPRHVLR